VQHGEDLDLLAVDWVGHHERRPRHHRLARARHPARTPAFGELPRAVDGLAQAPGHGLSRSRPVQGYVRPRVIQIGDGPLDAADDHRQRA
jgi:hypothetical protein